MKVKISHPTDNEILTLNRISSGDLRVVHGQRKRKLKRRGIYVRYFNYLGAFLWEPNAQLSSEEPQRGDESAGA